MNVVLRRRRRLRRSIRGRAAVPANLVPFICLFTTAAAVYFYMATEHSRSLKPDLSVLN